ncbi:MAG: helix-turn-helix domain-containing protein [Opitutaceae bacterium]|nr:helix-turn-helix domain-containing protein [Opitutaceae bacterium]
MSPDAKQILQSILKRDATLTVHEQDWLRSIIAGGPILPAPQLPTPQPPVTLGGQLLTRAQVAEHLNASISTVERLERTGQLTPISITSDCPRFLPEEVNEFIESRKARRTQRRHGTMKEGAAV